MTINDLKIKTIIVDDQSKWRKWIKSLLEDDESVEILGECSNANEAVEQINSLCPDLVFLDVQMPGRCGFDVLKDICHEKIPTIIFTSIYDCYALQAFENNALDFLLKPFCETRFKEAYSKAKERILKEVQLIQPISGRLLDIS